MFLSKLFSSILSINFLDIIDIFIVSFVIYQLLLWFKGTRALQLVKGAFLVLGIYLFSNFLGLQTINWLLQKLTTIILIVLIIVFQPELRRMLERLGRGKLMSKLFFTGNHGTGTIQVIMRAVEQLSEQKYGSIIVLERESGLEEYIESGVSIDGKLTPELLVSIFNKHSLLHDGALIIQGNRIIAASCLLPLSDSRLIDTKLGTRHRAAIGLSEQADAVVIVTSEETGVISIAENGVLTRYLNKQNLEKKLLAIYQDKVKESSISLDKLFKKQEPKD